MNTYAIKIANCTLMRCHVERVGPDTGINQYIAVDPFTEGTDNVYTTVKTVFPSTAEQRRAAVP
jgi:hypothetical protein